MKPTETSKIFCITRLVFFLVTLECTHLGWSFKPKNKKMERTRMEYFRVELAPVMGGERGRQGREE